jgi:hypothetical protein
MTLVEGALAAILGVRSAAFLAAGGSTARGIEHLFSHRLTLGAFVVVAADVR